MESNVNQVSGQDGTQEKVGMLDESPGVKSGKRVAGFIALANLVGLLWFGAIKTDVAGVPIMDSLLGGASLLAIVAGTLLGITAIETAVKSFAEARFGRK